MFLTTSTRYGSNPKGASYTVEQFDNPDSAREAFEHNIDCDTWIIPGEYRNDNVHVIAITPDQVMTVWQQPKPDRHGDIFCVITYTLTSNFPIVGL